MQPASPTFPPPPSQNGYQPLSEAEIYAIKRQYLGLLSPPQIIDICLTFEAHAPLHVKSTVWPYDIRASIASLQAQKTTSESDASLKTSAPDVDASSTTRPSSSQQSTPAPSQAGPAASGPQPSASQPSTPGPHYPHHPYFHPAYPHAPYYASPHPPYGYHPYPPYPPPPPPAMYPVNPPNHHPPLFTNVPLVHPSHPPPEPQTPHGGVDDLPSYEEMIVEALLDSGDPEGCAPKSLFSWMAMHYPLQMNFRPSASQALQKAYKRGRLEKGSNGRYRLNENWEGGNTSKRTTRRPQTLVQTGLPGSQSSSSSSPFTHGPLGPHGAAALHARPPPQPPGYGVHPFGYPYQCASGPAHAPGIRGPVTLKQGSSAADHETGEGSDAWEAAQNILKAINFGQLYQMPNEDTMTAGEPSTSRIPPNPATDGPPAQVVVEASTGARTDGAGKSTELNAEQRAALQAQLALLAAQLAEIADVTEDELSQNLDISSRTAATSDARTSQASGEGSGLGPVGDEGDHDDSEDMVEVPVPMASLTTA